MKRFVLQCIENIVKNLNTVLMRTKKPTSIYHEVSQRQPEFTEVVNSLLDRRTTKFNNISPKPKEREMILREFQYATNTLLENITDILKERSKMYSPFPHDRYMFIEYDFRTVDGNIVSIVTSIHARNKDDIESDSDSITAYFTNQFNEKQKFVFELDSRLYPIFIDEIPDKLINDGLTNLIPVLGSSGKVSHFISNSPDLTPVQLVDIRLSHQNFWINANDDGLRISDILKNNN